MRLARVVGNVTATVKPSALSGHKLLMIDIVDANDKVLSPSVVAVDTVGAGAGELCIVAEGSAARISIPGVAVDACIIAIVDHLSVE